MSLPVVVTPSSELVAQTNAGIEVGRPVASDGLHCRTDVVDDEVAREPATAMFEADRNYAHVTPEFRMMTLM